MIQWKAYLPERPKFNSRLSLTSFFYILQVTSNEMGPSGKKQILSKCNSSHLNSICVLLSYLWKSANYAQSPKILKGDLPKQKQTNQKKEKKLEIQGYFIMSISMRFTKMSLFLWLESLIMRAEGKS